LDDFAESGVPGDGLFPRFVFFAGDGSALLMSRSSGINIGVFREKAGDKVTFVIPKQITMSK
jgi:hypothetical protein